MIKQAGRYRRAHDDVDDDQDLSIYCTSRSVNSENMTLLAKAHNRAVVARVASNVPATSPTKTASLGVSWEFMGVGLLSDLMQKVMSSTQYLRLFLPKKICNQIANGKKKGCL